MAKGKGRILPDVLRHAYSLKQHLGYATKTTEREFAKWSVRQPVRVVCEFSIDLAKLDVLAHRAMRSQKRVSRGLYGAVVCRLVEVKNDGKPDPIPEGYVWDGKTSTEDDNG